MKKLNALVLIFVIFPLFVFSQSFDDKLKEIDTYAQQVITDWRGPGMAIAIVKDDKVVFQKGYGVRELGKPDKVDENTLFAIASNTKAFTTASLAILVDEKKLNWNDKVSKYLLVRHDLFNRRDTAARPVSQACFKFPQPLWLPESDVYRGR